MLEVIVCLTEDSFPFFFPQASQAGWWGVWAWARTVSWHHSFFSPHYSAFFVTVNLGLFGNFSHQHQTPFLYLMRWFSAQSLPPSHPDIPAPLFHSTDPSADCQDRRPGNLSWLTGYWIPLIRDQCHHQRLLGPSTFCYLLSAAPPWLFPRDLADGLNRNYSNARIQE